jgi:hypothetical protein
MSRRGRLKNVAAGLCHSFASRNNDLDGYWSIGKLRSLAEQYGRTTVSLDLQTSSIQPSSSEFVPVLARYQRLLQKLANLSRIRVEEIKEASITLDFAPPPWPRASYYRLNWGEQFVLIVTIKADKRATGTMRHAGYCRPHNPAMESRSTRPESR